MNNVLMREGFQFHQMLLLLTGQIDSVFCKGFEQLLLAPTPTPLIASYLCYNRLTALLLLTSSLLVLALVLVIVKEGRGWICPFPRRHSTYSYSGYLWWCIKTIVLTGPFPWISLAYAEQPLEKVGLILTFTLALVSCCCCFASSVGGCQLSVEGQ